MRRRKFIALLGSSVVAWPLAAPAQQRAKVWRIGFLAGGSRPAALGASVYGGFLRGMREIGLVEGKDFIMEWRFAEGRYELFPELAAELVRQNVDVIVTGTGSAVPAVQRATSVIPVVMGSTIDPVGRGFVASLAHPGGNITGLATSFDDTAPKQLELLAMVVPNLARVGVAGYPGSGSGSVLNAAQAAAKKAGYELVQVQIRDPDEVTSAFATLANEGVSAVMPTDRGACTEESAADDIRRTRIYRRRRIDELRRKHCGLLPARRILCGQDFQGRKSCRSADPAAYQVLSGD
jgi:putative ABC transport system substrate-binding protein